MHLLMPLHVCNAYKAICRYLQVAHHSTMMYVGSEDSGSVFFAIATAYMAVSLGTPREYRYCIVCKADTAL